MISEIGVLDKEDLYFQLAGIDPKVCLWEGHAITEADAPAIQNALQLKIREILSEDVSNLNKMSPV